MEFLSNSKYFHLSHTEPGSQLGCVSPGMSSRLRSADNQGVDGARGERRVRQGVGGGELHGSTVEGHGGDCVGLGMWLLVQ